MTKILATFTPDDQKELFSDFQKLSEICYPTANILKPRFKFLRQADFEKLDGLKYGSIANGYYMPPKELKTLWQSRQELKECNIDYIVSGGKKWFYNTQEIVGNFFSVDGDKKVEVDFNFWMDAEKVWKIPGVRAAMQKVLRLASGQNLPSEKAAQSCFPDSLCRQIYEQNPSQEAAGRVVLGMIEHLRKRLVKRLVEDQKQEIAKMASFQQFVIQNALHSLSLEQQVQTYLKKNKNAVYVLGQNFGYIKNANKMIKYQELRDHVRHPHEVPSKEIKPQEIYEDFKKALKISSSSKGSLSNLSTFDDHTRTVWNIEKMSEIQDILELYAAPSLNKKKAEYWNHLVKKGIITPQDIPLLQTRIQEYNAVAHGNPGADQSKVSEDLKIDQLSDSITKKHALIIRRFLHPGR